MTELHRREAKEQICSLEISFIILLQVFIDVGTKLNILKYTSTNGKDGNLQFISYLYHGKETERIKILLLHQFTMLNFLTFSKYLT